MWSWQTAAVATNLSVSMQRSPSQTTVSASIRAVTWTRSVPDGKTDLTTSPGPQATMSYSKFGQYRILLVGKKLIS